MRHPPRDYVPCEPVKAELGWPVFIALIFGAYAFGFSIAIAICALTKAAGWW